MREFNTDARKDSAPGGVEAHVLGDDGVFPNNGRMPVLVFRNALEVTGRSATSAIQRLFAENHWGGSWVNGIYGYHHYHSTAHEVLAAYGGTAEIQLGGENGVVVSIARGDVVIVPAGVAHKNLRASRDFRVVGAYPSGQHPDMNYGRAGERPRADESIARVPLPTLDPIYGAHGPLPQRWRKG